MIFRRWIFLTILAVIVSALVILPQVEKFLAIEIPLKPDVLLIEGWLPKTDLEQAALIIEKTNADKILIVGNSFPETTFNPVEFKRKYKEHINEDINYQNLVFIGNGSFVYIFGDTAPPLTNITVKARGSMAYGHYAHFNITLDSLHVGSAFVSPRVEPYHFELPAAATYRYMIINYDNDSRCNNDFDRNLVIEDILVNGEPLSQFGGSNYFVCSSRTLDYPKGVRSVAAECLRYLQSLNRAIGEVEILEPGYHPRNKTLSNALAVAGFFSHEPGPVKVLIVTTSHHSRRSYINYKNTAGHLIFGVLPVSSRDPQCGPPMRFLGRLHANADETASTMYTWLYWKFRK